MKTTLDLDDTLVAEAKAAAARQRTTLTRLVEDGLRIQLQARRRAVRGKRQTIPLIRGRDGLRPDVDPCSNRALLEAIEGRDDT